MVRTILTPEDTHVQLEILQEYVGKKIEITYLALDELEPVPGNKLMGDFLGILSSETATAMHKKVDELRNEWERNI